MAQNAGDGDIRGDMKEKVVGFSLSLGIRKKEIGKDIPLLSNSESLPSLGQQRSCPPNNGLNQNIILCE